MGWMTSSGWKGALRISLMKSAKGCQDGVRAGPVGAKRRWKRAEQLALDQRHEGEAEQDTMMITKASMVAIHQGWTVARGARRLMACSPPRRAPARGVRRGGSDHAGQERRVDPGAQCDPGSVRAHDDVATSAIPRRSASSGEISISGRRRWKASSGTCSTSGPRRARGSGSARAAAEQDRRLFCFGYLESPCLAVRQQRRPLAQR